MACQFLEDMDYILFISIPLEPSTVPGIHWGSVMTENMEECEIIHVEKIFSYIIVGMDFLPSIFFNSLINFEDSKSLSTATKHKTSKQTTNKTKGTKWHKLFNGKRRNSKFYGPLTRSLPFKYL